MRMLRKVILTYHLAMPITRSPTAPWPARGIGRLSRLALIFLQRIGYLASLQTATVQRLFRNYCIADPRTVF
jgi:hypothetical protein